MKILLTQDVPTLGLAGDIRTVAVGYARNYLMPRGYAILATKGACSAFFATSSSVSTPLRFKAGR